MILTTSRTNPVAGASTALRTSLLLSVLLTFSLHHFSVAAFLVPPNHDLGLRVVGSTTRSSRTEKRYASIAEEQEQQGRPYDVLITRNDSADDDKPPPACTTPALKEEVLQLFHAERWQQEAREYADQCGLGAAEATLYRLFATLRRTGRPLGLKSEPFCLRSNEISGSSSSTNTSDLAGFFTMKDLEKAVVDDFLDAARGSTDNRKGWQVSGENCEGELGLAYSLK